MQRDGGAPANSGRGDKDLTPPRGAAALYRVGDLIVDIGQARVTRGDRGIALPKLSFDLLVALIHRAPNLVSTDDLMAQVWPGLVVNLETVSQRVKLLRDALDDDPKEPRYIGSVRGRGYRLIASVETLCPAPSAPSTLEAPPPSSPPTLPSSQSQTLRQASAPTPFASPTAAQRPGRRRAMFGAVLLLAAAVAAIGVWQLVHRQSPPQTRNTQITVAGAPVRSIAILPFATLSTEPNARALALGISESVMHQLASHNQLLVIARTSSFAFEGRNLDAREIGRELNARYLLEGSLQSTQDRLRVTAQLVDSQTGARMWSMRFDKNRTDLFDLQDEIAAAVTRELESSVRVSASARATGPGTMNLEAWIAYQQGRALAATRKFADLEQAEERFAEAMRLDPAFASAYVARAEARLVRSMVQRSDSWLGLGPQLSPAEKIEVDRWLAQAIELNDRDGTAYTVRAWSRENPYEAETDYRRGLALTPNDAVGYERFSKLLYSFRKPNSTLIDPARRDEAFAMIARARQLDPLSITALITQALMLFYGRGNAVEADTLLLQAFALQPNYYPVIARLAEVRFDGLGDTAEGIKYGEQALSLEPQAAWTRRFLELMYLDIGDLAAAQEVAAESAPSDNLTPIRVYLSEHKWVAAGDLAYGSDASFTGLDVGPTAWALVRHAQATGQVARAIKRLEEWTEIKWDAHGEPTVYESNAGYSDLIALAQLLRSTGQAERARRLLRAVERLRDHGAHELKRTGGPCSTEGSATLVLSGDREGALRTLQDSFAGMCFGQRQVLEVDPSFDDVRGDPRFQAVLARVIARADEQRRRLDALRTAGAVPRRPK
jgi:TolB-like protein/DNA-binding winged helix-turn-helix (wHTH) protein